MSDGNKGAAAKAKAREVKDAISKLEWRDRVAFLASVALVPLFFFSWWRFELVHKDIAVLLGVKTSDWISGWRGTGWPGFLAACLAPVIGLTNMGFVPLPPGLKRIARMTAVQFGVAAFAFFAGPFYFLCQKQDPGYGRLADIDQGKTLFFWLALLAGFLAAGATGWKFVDEIKAAKAKG